MKAIFSRLIIFFVIQVISFNICYPQSLAFRLGDRCDDLKFDNLYNYKSASAHLSDFKGKLVILDFWATWCGACVNMLPTLDSLSRQFSDKIQIISVTSEDKNTVANFSKKLKAVKGIDPPTTVTSDTVLWKLFPHKFLPHYIWINGNGVVQGVTDRSEVTSENIEKMLSNHSVSLLVTDDTSKARPFNYKSELLTDINGVSPDKKVYSAALTNYVSGWVSSFNMSFLSDSNFHNRRILAINQQVIVLYSIAYGKPPMEPFPIKKIFFEVEDTLKYFFRGYRTGYDTWKQENTYCYDLVVSKSLQEEKFKIMQMELDRLFNLKSRVERRKIKCLTLVRTSSTEDHLLTKNMEPKAQNRPNWIKLQNQPISKLLYLFTYYYMPLAPPVLDETNYKSNIDIEINADLSDVSSIRRELQKFGLDLREQLRDVDVLVISKGDTNKEDWR